MSSKRYKLACWPIKNWSTCGAVKRDFRTYIRYTSPNVSFEYGYPHSNALLQFCLKLECCKLHNAGRHPPKCDVINHIKLFPTLLILFCLFYREIQTASQSKMACIFPILEIFFPNLRILLGFILKFKRHRLHPQKGNKITVQYIAGCTVAIFSTISNHKWRYKSKCIKMDFCVCISTGKGADKQPLRYTLKSLHIIQWAI